MLYHLAYRNVLASFGIKISPSNFRKIQHFQASLHDYVHYLKNHTLNNYHNYIY